MYLLRVNFVGALGWELHFPIEYAHHLFDAIFAAGAEYGIGMAGMRAMESLRLEKSYRMWGSDLTPDYTPLRGGPRPLRAHEQGRLHRQGSAGDSSSPRGVPHRFVTFEVHGVTDADPLGNEPLFDARRQSSSAARPPATTGTRCGKSLGLGYVKPEFAAVGTELADRDSGRAQARHGADRLAL